MGKLISGKEVSTSIRAKIKEEAQKLRDDYGIQPGLAVILVGNDPASQIYVRNKQKACEEVGFHAFEYRLNENSTQEQLLDLIGVLNKDNKVHGILVQLPLPDHIDPQTVINTISPEKDVDAFHPINVGKIMLGDYEFLPCTPAGVMELIDSTGVEISGKNCVVVGRSNIVGKPMAMLLLHRNATVTICHSRTKNLAEICAGADILVSAVGKAHFITADMVKEGAMVIDVGMNHDENGKLCGDVEFSTVEPKASYITPVPGGVGPMTITMLMKNTLRAAELKCTKSAK
ncbi:bifunctional methylenetetrahydrofolate dehydrogenase/methenyltetrahydrofolate cyclohydrolase FolD [Ruminococcus sp.]|jgi:methylenetetrahydrofolate dehydrogenase (NADP+)/methenyltetrahydrofolate cyclohydrolase|uniref:bifunctional methylenetetrahydrofolate dehydrogenase/methenyltetrahydrofolate cyclohydrolase FolD n=1 Tax=Ruminococcus sp. TaxID=41978 RepID=UPI0026284EE4|nr:bifunctional methylenetetrahydrofolate dehydrogenase/methenyltetrahydrofolate cyclohydrolase FolD [Ruminococcus sp.]MEE0022785.1 bifunctional methylenetetrahydrofolate dehydrogenase/methenyltetrahydrofolate cyclohydrolase FolD [Ruminococcus sp.]